MSGENTVRSTGLLGTIGAGITKLRNFVFNTIFLLLALFVVVAALSTCQSSVLPEDSALLLNPVGTVVEVRTLPRGLADLLPAGQGSREIELATLLSAIRLAAADDNIKMMVLDLENLVAVSPAQANRIGDELNRFKQTGKKVVSYGDYYSQGQYHIASFADEIYMHPYGQAIFTGYGGSNFYLKDILDKFAVNVHVFRVGDYKSAVEPLTRNNMSEESRLATEQLYQDLWQHFIADIANNRQIADHQVQDYADRIDELVSQTNGDLARAALENHLIDELMTPDQALTRIAQEVGYADTQTAELNGVDFQTYVQAKTAVASEGPFVDIITVQGAITLEGDSFTTANANAIVELIRHSRSDPETGAIVLRVDSPGGSQFASELIRQELELAQLSGTPVVASFGSAAASGGYWVAATADEIVSEATTITGSIGIFSLLMTFENSLRQFGVHSDGVGTSANTTGLDQFTGINTNISALFQSQVDHGYEQFITLVAKGRAKTLDETQALANGRVWSGEAALESGLVDHLGGMQIALERAATLAELESWQSRRRVQPSDPRSELLAAISQVSARFLPSIQLQSAVSPIPRPNEIAGQLVRTFKQLSVLKDPKHLQVFCMQCVLPAHDPGDLYLLQ